MRLLALAIVGALGCTAPVPTSDAARDAVVGSFDQPIGAACSTVESPLCAQGIGICHHDMCRAFCNAVELPHCPTGTVEVHDTIADRKVCLCMPAK
jgi:hypothetical protein